MRKGKCKYFNGLQNNKCKIGITYPAANVLPCFAEELADGRIACPKYEEPTSQEIADYNRRLTESFRRMEKMGPLIVRIKKEHEGQAWQGIEKCPVCGGELMLFHAAINGHVWGKCKTQDCIAWME